MSISVEHPLGPDLALVTLVGEHDLSTVSTVRRVLNDLAGSPQTVVLDLTRCAFVDSTVLGAFAGAAKRARAAGGRVVAVNAEGVVAKAMHLTGIDALLAPTELEGSFVQALQQLGRPVSGACPKGQAQQGWK